MVLDGVTTSFRYPHFLAGRHPSLPVPPPSTIYGHICSAAGSLIRPDMLRFAYSFSYQGAGDDVEHLHIIDEIKVGKARKRANSAGDTGNESTNIVAQVGPVNREIMLFPHLELYVGSPDESLVEDLHDAFQTPVFPVVLGRSQDLCSYRSVEIVGLTTAARAYYEATILPWAYRLRTTAGFLARMPCFIDPESRRDVMWNDYLVLPSRAVLEPGPPTSARVSAGDGDQEWVDSNAPAVRGFSRAVVWHSFAPSPPNDV